MYNEIHEHFTTKLFFLYPLQIELKTYPGQLFAFFDLRLFNLKLILKRLSQSL